MLFENAGQIARSCHFILEIICKASWLLKQSVAHMKHLCTLDISHEPAVCKSLPSHNEDTGTQELYTQRTLNNPVSFLGRIQGQCHIVFKGSVVWVMPGQCLQSKKQIIPSCTSQNREGSTMPDWLLQVLGASEYNALIHMPEDEKGCLNTQLL